MKRGASSTRGPSDRSGGGLRLGCGGLFGLVVGLVWFGDELFRGAPLALALVPVAVVACAVLAWRYGDAFWDHVRHADWWHGWDFWLWFRRR